MATRWGIASAGKISHDFVLAMSTLPPEEHLVVAVAARDSARAKDFAKNFNIPNSYGSYLELAKDTNVEVVYVGSINTEHLALGKLFLDHGKHILMEKPLCMNTEECQTLINYAKEKKLFLMEAIWSRAFPVYKALRQKLDAGTIGEVLRVDANFGIPINSVPRVSQKELGGSAVLDIGIYVIQLALFVFGKPAEIKALGGKNKDGVDTYMSAILKYPDGKLATLSIDTRVTFPNEARIVGTNGTIILPSPFWCPTEIITPDGTETHALPAVNREFHYGNSCGLRYEAIEVRKCLKQGLLECPIVSHQESLNIAEVEEEIIRQIGK